MTVHAIAAETYVDVWLTVLTVLVLAAFTLACSAVTSQWRTRQHAEAAADDADRASRSAELIQADLDEKVAAAVAATTEQLIAALSGADESPATGRHARGRGTSAQPVERRPTPNRRSAPLV